MITRDEACELLKKYITDPFHIQHSLTVEAVMKWYAKELGYAEAAEYWGIVGLLHDIGRRCKFGFVDIPTHVYEGYKYCMEKGWDEAARICMTHSYLQMKDEFDYEP